MIISDSGAKKIESGDNWREIFDDHNGTVEALDKVTADLAPIIKGNTCAAGAAAGDYVLLCGSTISGKADGAYIAAKAIPANTALDATYLGTALDGGIANSLNSKFDKFSGFSTEKKAFSSSATFSLESNTAYLFVLSSTDIGSSGLWVVRVGSTGTVYAFKVTIGTTGTNITVTTATGSITFSVTSSLTVQAVAMKLF